MVFAVLCSCAAPGQAPSPEAAPTPEATPPPAVSKANIVSEATEEEPEFGPVVQAYLAYLQDEQNVTDDIASRHEVSPAYYRRNTNRIRALRAFAINLARASQNDYLPELVAVARDELRTIFLRPPAPQDLRNGEVYADTFRHLGTSSSGGVIFYIFARLAPYEEEEWRKQKAAADKAKSVEP
jgi:hypothetical protein